MRLINTLCAMLGIVAIALAAQTATYSVSPAAGAKFELIVKKTGFLSGKQHLFVFPRYSGELAYNASAPEESKITLHIDSTSIECKDDWVSEGDRKKVMNEATNNMLQISKYKEMIFQSKTIQRLGDGSYLVQGDLSIRGTPKPVSVKVKMKENSDGSIAFTGDSTVDMTAWGLKPPKALLGAIGTEKDMLVSFSVVAKKP